MDTETLKSLAELGYAFILIAWLMKSSISLEARKKEIEDRFIKHLEGDIDALRDDVRGE